MSGVQKCGRVFNKCIVLALKPLPPPPTLHFPNVHLTWFTWWTLPGLPHFLSVFCSCVLLWTQTEGITNADSTTSALTIQISMCSMALATLLHSGQAFHTFIPCFVLHGSMQSCSTQNPQAFFPKSNCLGARIYSSSAILTTYSVCCPGVQIVEGSFLCDFEWHPFLQYT